MTRAEETPLWLDRLRLLMLRSSGCSSPPVGGLGPLPLLGGAGLVGVGGVVLASLDFVVRSKGDSPVGLAPGPPLTILCSCSRGDLGSDLKNMLGLRVPRSVVKG